MSISANRTNAWPIANLLHDVRGGNSWLWRSTLAFSAGLFICAALLLIDHRLFNGVNVWDKPAKFFLSFVVQFATLSWALSLLPAQQRKSRGVKTAVAAMSVAAWFEMAYMIFRASRGEASHFNRASIFAQVMYGMMGAGAITLVGTACFIGFLVWKHRKQSLITEAAGLGLMLGMVLATVAGVYMSSMQNHWVGGDLSDAHGLGLFTWSTTGGDLRVAHFVGMHAAQFIPLAALNGDRRVVYGVAAASVILTVTIFVMSMSGIPLFRA
ncbi:MAG: hypothetical protein M3O03_15020 [Pseudomonadota bacterium]|nr:hypothetical protein [Pseudomonadota bacterium]